MMVVNNAIYNVFNKGVNVVFPLIVSAYISRIFQAKGVGEIAFVINIITYFNIAASLGIPNYAMNLLSLCRDNKERFETCYSEMVTLVVFSSCSTAILYYCFIQFFFKDNANSLLYSEILGLILISNVFNYDWLFESKEDYRFLAIRSVLVKMVALFLLFALVNDIDDIIYYCFIYSFVIIANNVISFIYVRKYVHYSCHNISLKRHLRPIFILFAAAIATELYTLLDSTMLGIKCEPEYLAYYSNSSRIVRAVFGVLYSAISVTNPKLSYFYSKDKTQYKKLFQQYYDQAMLIAVPSTLGLSCVAENVIYFMYGEGYESAYLTLSLLAFLIIIFMIATVFGHVPLVIYGKEKKILHATIIGAISNFLLNQLFIPIFKHNGAALASIISELFVTSFLFYTSIKCFKIKVINKNVFSVLISGLLMVFVIEMLKKVDLHITNLTVLFLYVILGCVIYFFSLILLRNRIVIDFINERKFSK